MTSTTGRSARGGRVSGVALGVAALLALTPSVAVADGFTITNEDISSPVGLAADSSASLYWAVNRSSEGSTTRVFGLSESGRTRKTVTFGARTEAVEALAMSRNQLYVGDIGDEQGAREFVTVIRLSSLAQDRSSYRAWDFSYPDGRHDARAMFVANGRVHMVTRGDAPGIYAAAAEPSTSEVNELRRVADAPAGVTDATIDRAGRVVLRTSSELFVYDPDWTLRASGKIDGLTDGEALTTTFDRRQLLASGVGTGAEVVRMPVPTTIDPQVSASAQPSPTPSGPATSPATSPAASQQPTAATTSEAAEDAPHLAAPNRRGTLVALIAAGVVAVLAAAVVYFRR